MRQSALFAPSGRSLVREDGDVQYLPEYLDRTLADTVLAEVRASTIFVADTRMMYGRRVAVPRETAGRGERMPQGWTPALLDVRSRLERTLGTPFDYVFINRYRDGRDSVAWHGDHDGREDPRKIVASLSLGATRAFDLRPKPHGPLRPRLVSVDVAHGDLIVMAGETQRTWEHRVRRDLRVHEERINLTFRQHRAGNRV